MVKTPRVRRWIALSSLVLLLPGCASPPEKAAERALQTEAAARTQVREGGVSYSQERLPELKEDSSLASYLAYAGLNNPGLEAAFNRWKAALEMVLPARTLPDPRFNYDYFIQSVETRTGPQQDRLGLSQTFPWFGKLQLRGEAALQAANSAQQQYEAAKLKLFDDVKQACYELYYLGRAITVTRNNLNLVRELEQIALAKYQAGTALHADVIKAQVELDTLRDRLQTLQALKSPTVARLNAALNRPAAAPLPFPAKLSPGTLPAPAHQLLLRLEAANPELKRLDFLARQEQASVALAKKEFFPDVSLGLGYIVTGPARTPGTPDSGEDPILAGFSINLPIWWNKYRAQLRSAQTRVAATREERRDLANRLASLLELSLFKFQDAERKIVLYRDALLPKAEEDLKVIQRSYETGQADFLSLIDAQRVLLEFQLAFQRALADREQGLAAVERLVGAPSLPPATEAEATP